MTPRTTIPTATPAARLLLLARLRHGRPRVLAARLLAALLRAEIAAHSRAGPAPTFGALAGIVTWPRLHRPERPAPQPGR